MSGVGSLRAYFYDNFDVTVSRVQLERLLAIVEQERRRHENFMGEGFHFQAFHLGEGLVLKVPKKSFLDLGEKRIQDWTKAIKKTQEIQSSTMIPPMEILWQGQIPGIVMPHGELRAGKLPNLVTVSLNDTAKALGKAGLVLDDYPAVGERKDQFFILDWSDLKFAGGSM